MLPHYPLKWQLKKPQPYTQQKPYEARHAARGRIVYPVMTHDDPVRSARYHLNIVIGHSTVRPPCVVGDKAMQHQPGQLRIVTGFRCFSGNIASVMHHSCNSAL